MWMNNFDTNNDCVLIIGKHDDIVPHDKMYDEMWFNSRAYEYNHKTKERIFTGVYDLETYDTMLYTNVPSRDEQDVKILATPFDRFRFICASLHDDKQIFEMFKKEFPEIRDIEIPSLRATSKYYLKHWMEKYNFTLEDFWKNNKYKVIFDNPVNHVFFELADLGLLDWDNFEHTSEDDNFELND